MPASLRPRDMLPGIHRVRASLSRGRVAEYWYAFRGGPQILKAVARSDDELAREVAKLSGDAGAKYKDMLHPAPAKQFLGGLIETYLQPGEDGKVSHFKVLAPRTVKDIRKALDVVRIDLGEMETQALSAKGARKAILQWRDRYKATPKTADARMEALARVLRWAREAEEIAVNPIEEWPRLYKVNRADVVWTRPDLIKLLRGAPKDFKLAVLVAVFTGLRLADLTKLAWKHVGEDAITFATGKSNGRRVVVVPITPKLRGVLNLIGRKDVGTVLTSSRGEPWTGSGLQTAMQRRKKEAGISGLRFHDLRGTAATHFIRAGLPVVDVALIVGWDREKTAALASYVTAEAVAAGMLERLRKNKRGV